MSTSPPSLLPLHLESFRIGFAGIAGIMSVAHLPWFARSIGILRSGLAQVSTPLDDDMENIATEELPGACILLALAPANGSGEALTVVAIKILLAHMWFTAGLRKLQNAGCEWSVGSTLRHHLATKALENRTHPHDSMGM